MGRPSPRAVCLRRDVGLEESFGERGVDAGALVFHLEHDVEVGLQHPHEDRTRCAGHRFFGVLQQVDQHLGQLIAIDAHHRVGRERDVEVKAVVIAVEVHHRPHHVTQLEGLQLGPGEPRELAELVDDALEAIDFFEHRAR